MGAVNQILDFNGSYSKIGSISKSYGNRGEVLIKIFGDSFLQILESVQDGTESLSSAPPVFLLIDGIYTPFFFETLTQKGASGFVVKFTTVSDSSHAEELAGHDIFTHDSLLNEYLKKKGRWEKEDEQQMDLRGLIGYIIENEDGREIGTIEDVIEYPANVCLNISLSSQSAEPQQHTATQPDTKAKAKDSSVKEVLIPFHPDLLLGLDQKRKRIAMKIAKGLLQHF